MNSRDNYDIYTINDEGEWILYMTTSWLETANAIVNNLLAQGRTAQLQPTMLRRY
jgi:hypothetical protein